jgi:hypothetical protein
MSVNLGASLYKTRRAALDGLKFGPFYETILIVENIDEEGGVYDIYSGDRSQVLDAVKAIREYEQFSRSERVRIWKEYGWTGPGYKHCSYTIYVIGTDGAHTDYSLPEEETGCSRGH